jgi:hypothetical protein
LNGGGLKYLLMPEILVLKRSLEKIFFNKITKPAPKIKMLSKWGKIKSFLGQFMLKDFNCYGLKARQ